MGVVSDTDHLVKGTPTLGARDWLDERLGDGWFHRTLAYKYPDWPERILPGEFYPLRPQIHGWNAALKQIDGFANTELMVREAAARIAEQDLKTIYKAFLWAASPKTFLRAAPRLWSSYARFGALTTTRNETGLYEARLTGVPEEFVPWCAGSLVGYLRPALLLAGGENPNAAILNRRKADDSMLWEFDYRLTYE